MSDEELVKRLRKGDTPMANHYMDEAADRIEALLNLNEALVELMDDRDANLAKVVSIAKRITSFEDTTEELAECGCARCKAHLKLRATLAEIEGEKT
jgi:hypothetical protein